MRRLAFGLIGATLLCVPALAMAQEQLSVYGYFSTRVEKGFGVPSYDGTEIVKETLPHEFASPFFSFMAQSPIGDRFRAFVNFNGSSGGALTVRNSWGEYNGSNAFNLRVGRQYRRFGLYNENLDATPTYYGIEPPETFDTDHLIVSRTTMAMVYGRTSIAKSVLNYSITTDNGEGKDIFKNAYPVGVDLNCVLASGKATVGFSGYNSGGWTNSDVSVGDGSPKSGVLPWMERDHFSVMNGYVEGKLDRLTLQFEVATADHKAVRDASAVLDLVANAGLNDAQRARFLIDPAGTEDAANVNLNGDYQIQTWYTRAGYSIESRLGEFGPYVQWDYYSNPETVNKKSFGGDAEAGDADDGKFNKSTLGLVYRPVPEVAFKFDGSQHYYKYKGENVNYTELRFDVSYTFGL
jgi:hypothetical protein